MRKVIAQTLGVAWLCMLPAILPACSGMTKKPEVSLLGIELMGIGFVEQQVRLKLKVRNPNDRDIALETLDFAIALADQAFAHGQAHQPLRVAGQGEAVLDVRAVSRLGVLLRQYQAARREGRHRIPYHISGAARVDGVGLVPFERRGELEIPCANCSPGVDSSNGPDRN